ncbi:peptide chain release factor N(5)-glutamine methyltransferase [Polycladomyces sp. WAk]|uniref:Release factor glutamine methyltransferase n=1 Tax=Polycladomyces zharkentensis TaxID=2807616 RepID=A0ABS2WF53_9BACL|nr:peptide chain release factor N(5)-glutamine methyltransferase [Polycladomyces sp. WAk]MBN2908069.1 peptide chain release factor N(5)-glutamine methyltransferase [Polycladomyces sp. WAk]
MSAFSSVKKAYRWAAERLGEQGEPAWFESELLLRSALEWDRTRFFTRMDEPVPEEAADRFQTWVMRAAAGEPLQYLIGEQAFFGRSFRVDPSVLIPRPETEILVERVLAEADRIFGRRPVRVVDIGTGSGAIAVTLACERPHWEVWAIDLSPQALATAQANAARHGVESRIVWRQGDLLEPLVTSGKHAQVVVSNPPYIPRDVIPTLAKRVRDFEPVLALDGGIDGLDVYRRIVGQLPDVLDDPALVAMEVGAGQSDAVAEMLQQLPMEVRVDVTDDLAGIPRVVCANIQKIRHDGD